MCVGQLAKAVPTHGQSGKGICTREALKPGQALTAILGEVILPVHHGVARTGEVVS